MPKPWTKKKHDPVRALREKEIHKLMDIFLEWYRDGQLFSIIDAVQIFLKYSEEYCYDIHLCGHTECYSVQGIMVHADRIEILFKGDTRLVRYVLDNDGWAGAYYGELVYKNRKRKSLE